MTARAGRRMHSIRASRREGECHAGCGDTIQTRSWQPSFCLQDARELRTGGRVMLKSFAAGVCIMDMTACGQHASPAREDAKAANIPDPILKKHGVSMAVVRFVLHNWQSFCL